MASRAIRVFVSSTFRDMHLERDELVKRVFPELRAIAESRGASLIEIDLRWGLTDEQKAEGRVLPICLEEIAQSRPYFIGLLGERYGWIPESLETEIVEREDWLRRAGDRSVTELEILHGVLNDPGMAAHAFFYFRDPDYARRLPAGEHPADYTTESPEAARKLAALKDAIRASGLPVREKYSDARALGALVLEDLSRVIDTEFPARSVPGPTERERAEQAAFADSRRRVYIGNPAYSDALTRHADAAGPPLVVTGASGLGKSALLANWAAAHAASRPDVPVIAHFVGATADSTDWAAMLRQLIAELQTACGVTRSAPASDRQLAGAFNNTLNVIAAQRRFVLVIDGLDQLDDRDQAPDLAWLAAELPAACRLIVSSLPGRPLDETRRRGWPELEILPVGPDVRARIIAEYLRQYRKALSPHRVERIASTPACGNPLYLRALLEELRVFGVHERLDERIDFYLSAPTPESLYQRILERWEADYQRSRPGLVGDAMRCMWAARRGLSEDELLDLLGAVTPLPRAEWSPLYLAAAQSLVNRSGLLTFFHSYLRSAVETRYLAIATQRHDAHLTLAGYFDRRPPGPRRTDELPWQLAEAGEWPRLASLLADHAFFQRAWTERRQDLGGYWAAIESHSEIRMTEAYRAVVDDPGAHAALAARLAHLMHESGHANEAERIWSALLERAERTGHRGDQREFRRNLTVVLSERGDVGRSLALLQAQAADAEGDLELDLANTLNLVTISMRTGAFDIALTLLDRAESGYRAAGHAEGLRACLLNRAEILKAKGDAAEAAVLYDELERLSRRAGDLSSLAAAINGQAGRLAQAGDVDQAIARYRDAAALQRRIGDAPGLSVSAGNLAQLFIRHGRFHEALEALAEKERLCDRLADPAGRASVMGKRAQILLKEQRLDEAMALLQTQEQLGRDAHAAAQVLESRGNQAIVWFLRRDLDAASQLAADVEQSARASGLREPLQSAIGMKSLIALRQGDFSEALRLNIAQEDLCTELGDPETLQNCREQRALILDTQEEIARGSGDAIGLMSALANKAFLLSNLGRGADALPVAAEAFRIASGNRQTEVAALMKDLMQTLRANPKG